MSDRDYRLFINIPFCTQQCSFCLLETYNSVELLRDYIDGMIGELRLRIRDRKLAFETGYIGGGSPTLALPFLVDFINELREEITLDPSEFTIDAMPGTFGIPEATRLLRLGINRISLSIFSLNDQFLKEYGRPYDSEQAVIAYHILRQVGFKNIDLVLSIKDDSIINLWQETIELAATLEPEHITIWPIDKDGEIKECYLWADEYLTAIGFEHYEYHSFARKGFRSQFLVQKLRFSPQIGLGLSAKTIEGEFLERNYDKIEDYLDAVNGAELPIMSRERLIRKQIRIISGLKSFMGIKKDLIPDSTLNRYLKEGLFYEDGDMIYPTKIGYLLSEAVFNQINQYLV